MCSLQSRPLALAHPHTMQQHVGCAGTAGHIGHGEPAHHRTGPCVQRRDHDGDQLPVADDAAGRVLARRILCGLQCMMAAVWRATRMQSMFVRFGQVNRTTSSPLIGWGQGCAACCLVGWLLTVTQGRVQVSALPSPLAAWSSSVWLQWAMRWLTGPQNDVAVASSVRAGRWYHLAFTCGWWRCGAGC